MRVSVVAYCNSRERRVSPSRLFQCSILRSQKSNSGIAPDAAAFILSRQTISYLYFSVQHSVRLQSPTSLRIGKARQNLPQDEPLSLEAIQKVTP